MDTPDTGSPSLPETSSMSHLMLLRQLVAFQFKLAADGLRDILLSPVSIGAAVLGVLFSPGNPGRYFQALLEAGHKSDRWINLFGTVTHYEDGESSSDMYLTKVEQLIVQEYRKHKPDAP